MCGVIGDSTLELLVGLGDTPEGDHPLASLAPGAPDTNELPDAPHVR